MENKIYNIYSLTKIGYETPFYIGFSSNIILREKCHKCRFGDFKINILLKTNNKNIAVKKEREIIRQCTSFKIELENKHLYPVFFKKRDRNVNNGYLLKK